MWGQWDYISYGRGVQLILFQFVAKSVYITLGLLSYLSGFLHITSLTDARANCKSTLPSVRTFLISFSTVFLSLRYSSLLFLNQIITVFNLDMSLLRCSYSCLLR